MASPERPAGSRMMNLPTDSLPMCWLVAWALAQLDLSRPSGPAWSQARSFLYLLLLTQQHKKSFSMSSGKHTGPFRTQIKGFLSQETFHDPSQLLLNFPGLGSIVVAFREASPDHTLNVAPSPVTEASPCKTASQDLPQSEFMLIIYACRFIFHPHRNCVLYQDSNLTASVRACWLW